MMNLEDATRMYLKVLLYFTEGLIWLEIMRQVTEKCVDGSGTRVGIRTIFLEYETRCICPMQLSS